MEFAGALTAKKDGFPPSGIKVDVLECPRCHGRLKVLGMVTELGEVRRFLKRARGGDDAPRAHTRAWSAVLAKQDPPPTLGHQVLL